MEDRVPHHQAHIADRPGAAQHESYAAAQGRQAPPTTDTDLGCAGVFVGSHAEDLPTRVGVSAQLISPAGASDFAQGMHDVHSACRLPWAEAVCTYRSLTSIQDSACKAGLCSSYIDSCSKFAPRACAAEGILLALSSNTDRYGLLCPMMSSMT